MTTYPLLFTDFQLTKESVLEETKNDPELARYYDYIKGGNLHILPELSFEEEYKNVHSCLPPHIVTIGAVIHINRRTEGIYKEVALNVRLWLCLYLKKILKRSNVWYAIIEFDKIPADPNDFSVIEVDVNKLLDNYNKDNDPKVETNVYYKFIDSESK